MPKVSFVTVNYNNHEGLARTLRELKKVKELSRLHDIELIVVDGGSDAEDIFVIDQFRDCLDRVISEKDNGIYDAMNKGISCATGNFVNFMNFNMRFRINDYFNLNNFYYFYYNLYLVMFYLF